MSSFFSRLSAVILMLTFAGATACSAGDRANSTLPNPAVDAPIATTKAEQTAVVAGGCFWGIQAVFQHVKGVISATSGYAGGSAKTAEYELVGTGETGHAESVKIIYDPSQNHLRPAASGLLLGGPRPHAVEPAGSRRRHPVSFVHFLWQRRPEADRRGVYCTTHKSQGLPAPHRDSGSSVEGFLSSRGLPPGLCCAPSKQPVYRLQRCAESCSSSRAVSGPIHQQVAP